MTKIILFNKPFRVLSQFTDRSAEIPRQTIADFIAHRGYRVAGRLDYESEGLLILTKDGSVQQRITNPKNKLWKTYLVQVEGEISRDALLNLQTGVLLNDGYTRPAIVAAISPPKIWERKPTVRYRKSIPDSWICISIQEGRNRQVRRMTAAVGFPTLRLVRTKIGEIGLNNLNPGEFCFISISSTL